MGLENGPSVKKENFVLINVTALHCKEKKTETWRLNSKRNAIYSKQVNWNFNNGTIWSYSSIVVKLIHQFFAL